MLGAKKMNVYHFLLKPEAKVALPDCLYEHVIYECTVAVT